jgi:hypothetical protein
MVDQVGVGTTGKVRSSSIPFSFNASANVLVTSTLYLNTTSAVGGASQNLQVSGGAYVSGNLGVGAGNPSQKLDVTGTIKVGGNSDMPAAGGGSLFFGGGYGSPNSGKIVIGDGTGWKFNISQRSSSTDTDLFTFTDGGLLLIGSTTPTGTAGQGLQVFSTGGAYVSGSVGVGIINPAQKFHLKRSDGVYGTAYQPIFYIDNVSSGGNTALNTGLGAIGWRIDSAYDVANIEAVRENPAAGTPSALVFRTNPTNVTTGSGTEAARITSAGNVGINTVTPTQKLHINGNQRLTGALYDTNNLAGIGFSVFTSTSTTTQWQNIATILLNNSATWYNYVGIDTTPSNYGTVTQYYSNTLSNETIDLSTSDLYSQFVSVGIATLGINPNGYLTITI